MKRIKFITVWVLIFIVVGISSVFLHECGHGFGAFLDGKNVSTGFNRVGNYNKAPSDSDFRPPDEIVTGEIGSSGFLGPFVTWSLAIVGTIFLLKRKNAGLSTIVLGCIALYNSLLRLVPLFFFFVYAVFGKFHIEDEAAWASRSVKELGLPNKSSVLESLLEANPDIYLHQIQIYFWPVVSFAIVLVCFILSLKFLFRLYTNVFSNLSRKVGFVFLVLVLFYGNYKIASILDNYIRINW